MYYVNPPFNPLPPPPPPPHTLRVRYVMEGGYVVPELGNNVTAVLMGHERSAGT